MLCLALNGSDGKIFKRRLRRRKKKKKGSSQPSWNINLHFFCWNDFRGLQKGGLESSRLLFIKSFQGFQVAGKWRATRVGFTRRYPPITPDYLVDFG